MSVVFPRTDVLSVEFTDQKFRLVERQEFSRTAQGRTIGKSFGSALWMADWTTAPMPLTDGVGYEAVLNSLDGVIQPFFGYDLRRPYPAAHSAGDFSEASVTVYQIGADGKSLGLDGLPTGFVLTRGDYIAFDYGSVPSRALHQVMETVTVDGTGISPSFEVRPHLRPGLAVGDPVILKKPSALFTLQPGSVESIVQDGMFCAISFSAVQVL
jgi:hypothetical protein